MMARRDSLSNQTDAIQRGVEMHQIIEAVRISAYRDTRSHVILGVLIGIAIGASLMLVMFEAINMLGNVG
jgi:hypothetical protein